MSSEGWKQPSLPAWAEAWAGGTCPCGSPTVTVLCMNGTSVTACCKSGWDVSICRPMTNPCQCRNPLCPDHHHTTERGSAPGVTQ